MGRNDEVLVTREGAVHRLSLNRPDKINAFNRAMGVALLAALEAASADSSCRAILLRGEGRGFCSGQDLTEIPDGADLGHLLETGYAPIVRLLRAIDKPVICAVHGVAAGAGANLALACDIVLAAESARFLQAFIRIGLIPDVGGTWLLPRLVGVARARGMAMLGDAVTASQAEQWGMIWRAVPDDDLMPEAERLAAQLAAMPTRAIALMKQAFNASESASFEQQLSVEAEAQRKAGVSDDFREGVEAFRAKRAPRFTGT